MNIAGHNVISATTPDSTPVAVGWNWSDTATGLVKLCTSVSPYTFVTVGSASHGGPSPATTVTDVRTGENASVVGTATDYARSDHQHVIPASPVFVGDVHIDGQAGVDHSGTLRVTDNYAGEGNERAVIIAKRNSAVNGGTPQAGDGVEYLCQLQDTNGNYGNIGGFIARLVDANPATLKGRLEFAVKASGAYNAVFDFPAMVLDWNGNLGIGTYFGTLANAPAYDVHIYKNGGAVVYEDSGSTGASYGLISQSQRWNVSIGSDKNFHLYDVTHSREGLIIDAATGNITVVGTITAPTFVGNASTATKLATARAINGTNFDGSADITVTAAANTLTGTQVAVARGGTAADNTTQTYTPSLTNVSNLDASTAVACQYVRIGNVVIVSGSVQMDPTTINTDTELGLSLPIASNLSASGQLGGTASPRDVQSDVVAIAGDATNDRAQFRWICKDTSNRTYRFTFMYLVL